MANKNLSATITIGGTVSGTLKSALGGTKNMLRDIGSEITKLSRANKAIGADIRIFDRLGRNVEGLRQRYADTVREIERLRVAQRRLGDSTATRDRLQARAGGIAKVGAGATVAGGVLIGSMIPGIQEAKHYQNEMARVTALGLGDEENKKAIKYAQEMKAFGVSQVGKLELMRDAMSIFGDEHHAEMVLPTLAKMKFGNAAVFGGAKGTENSAAFMDMLKVIETRGGLSSTEEFNKQANIIQRVISATGGRVGGTEWRHFLQQAGLIGKSMDSEALFYTMEHLVQEMGGDKAGTGLGSLYTSLYQGTNKTRNVRNMDSLGLIGDKSKVIHDKTGQTSKLNPGALLGATLFREDIFKWMQTVLLPQLAKKGITEDQQIMDTFGMIASNTVGTRFLAEMYRQRNIIERKRNTIKNAQDVDQLANAGEQGASGKELDAHAKLDDAKKQLGENILPLYTRALVAASDALVTFNKFTEANPRLSNAVVVGVTAIGAALVVIGPILGVIAGGLALYASAQLAATVAAIGGVAILPMLGSAIVAIGSVLATVGTALLLNPIGATITAIAVAALLIYKYWEPIKTFAAGLWDDVTGSFKKAMDWISLKMEWFGKKWAEFKSWLNIGGTVEVKQADGSAGMPAASPQAAGAANGESSAPAQPALPANALAGAYAVPEIPPMRGAVAPIIAPSVTNTNTYHITQLPGESAETLARRIAAINARDAAVKKRGALTDEASTQ